MHSVKCTDKNILQEIPSKVLQKRNQINFKLKIIYSATLKTLLRGVIRALPNI